MVRPPAPAGGMPRPPTPGADDPPNPANPPNPPTPLLPGPWTVPCVTPAPMQRGAISNDGPQTSVPCAGVNAAQASEAQSLLSWQGAPNRAVPASPQVPPMQI